MGRRLRRLREERSLTLVEMSKLCDVGISTLSKIENGQVTPVYGTLRKITLGLGVPFERLVADEERQSKGARKSVTSLGAARNFVSSRYQYSMHASDLISKAMLPLVMVIDSSQPPTESDWSSHEGEEFIYALEGKVIVYLEHYRPITLIPGESIYIDSGMRHGFVNAGGSPARILSVTYDPKQAPELFPGEGIVEVPGSPSKELV